MWRWSWLILIVLFLGLIPAGVLAGSSAGITVTAVGYICEAPGGFTVTYISEYEVGLSWTKGEDAENTMVRAAIGRMPEGREDGYLVYYGTGESVTDWVNMETLSVPVYYRAWSQRADGQWEAGETTGFMEGISVLTACLIGLALGLAALAVWKKHFFLYLVGFVGALIIALHLADTSLIFGIPIGLLSAYMGWECAAWWF